MRLETNRSLSAAVVVSAPLICSGLALGQNSIDFQQTDSWQGGYNADIVLKADPGGSGLDDWTLSWMGSPEVLYSWNCTHEVDGVRTFLEHVSYNASISPGGSVVLGFTGVGDWPPMPMDVVVNGQPVQVLIEGEPMDSGDHGGGDDDGGNDDGGNDDECSGDLDGDGMVSGSDLSFVVANWNSADASADLDGSGRVDGADLTILISQWGECPGGHTDPCMAEFTPITCWGDFHDSNHNSRDEELVGGRTAITTEAMVAYNDLRAFFELPPLVDEQVGQWAFNESLTNNDQAWGNDLKGVGLYYAMQGAKVGWISDDAYYPQLLADIQRTARLVEDQAEMRALVMDMVRDHCHDGYAEFIEQNGMVDTFINTLKMEPHYGGWMHGRTHGFRSVEGVAINHDLNHLTVLSWDQMQPFMNDTFDWPQWNALDVSDSGVIEYFQSMVILGDPMGDNL